MPEVLLDTNALLLPFREHFPLESELRRVAAGATLRVPETALAELRRLAEANRAGAAAALTWARQFPVVASPGAGDDSIVAVAVRRGSVVATADRRLSERLQAAGVRVLRPRSRSTLVLWPAGPPRGDERPATVKNRPRLRRSERSGRR